MHTPTIKSKKERHRLSFFDLTVGTQMQVGLYHEAKRCYLVTSTTKEWFEQ